MSEYVRTDKQLLAAAFGIATSLLTAILLALIEVFTGFALYSLTFWFVVPVGAFLAGFGAASGYYLGAILFQQKPAGGVLFNMVAASVSTFVLVYYIPYSMLVVDGVRVKDVISFWDYLDFAITHTSLSLVRGKASTGELGSLGYVHAGLQLIGFSLGGVGVFGWLSQKPYCKKCSRYLKKTGLADRFWFGHEFFVKDLETFSTLLDSQKFNEAVRFHNEKMGVTEKGDKNFRARLITSTCHTCGINHLSFVASRRHRDDWKDITGTEIGIFTEEPLDAAGKTLTND